MKTILIFAAVFPLVLVQPFNSQASAAFDHRNTACAEQDEVNVSVDASSGVHSPARSTRTGVIPFERIGALASQKYCGDGLGVVSMPEGARLRCVFQRLDALATKTGLCLASTVSGSGRDLFRVIARAVGREHLEPLPVSGRVEVRANSARWIRPGLREEYTVSVDGVRQDFVIEQRPTGAGPLRLELEVEGANAEAMVGGAQLVMTNSGRKLVYHRLKAVDGLGRELAVRLEVPSASRLALVLEDAAAEYPVRIDPTFSDQQWVSLGGLPGADAVVEDAVVDSQGDLYIGGAFSAVGHVAANFVAKWNGSAWSALGSGMNDVVDSLAVSTDDTLYAGGSFTMAGGVPANCIAKWDGSEWSALGLGLSGGFPFTYVAAIAVSNETVYAGGLFTLAGGGLSANYIAQWDGSTWSALGSGMNDTVHVLKIWNGQLYAGGSFNSAGGSPSTRFIARWDGVTWSALGSGVDYGVNALAVLGTNLYVGGNFNRAFNSGGVPVAAPYVAQWNGSAWSSLGAGMDNTVIALTASGTNLYAGGIFATAGGVPVNHIARWNGNAWSALGSGIHPGPDGGNEVDTLVVSGNTLYAGGHFISAGEVSATHIAQWNGSSWSTVGLGIGLDNSVSALAVSDGSLYVGGFFTFAGGAVVNRIARWNGSSWSALGLGLNSRVTALALSGSNLYAGGLFTVATNGGGAAVPVNRIARWNGNEWSALGSGMNSGVRALAVAGTNLYAGGGFTMATNSGGVAVTANCIAQWNGSSWAALGSGMSSAGEPASVRALAVSSEGTLYAGGYFASAGGATAGNIARWNAISWKGLGRGTSGEEPFDDELPAPVMALATSGSTLFAGGIFTSATNFDGSMVPANYIAQWDGSAWSALGSGISGDNPATSVRALAVTSDGALYAGGRFDSAGGVSALNIACWDGSEWSALGSGISGNGLGVASVDALTVSGTSLFAGGPFTVAGPEASAYVAQAILEPPIIITTNSDIGFTNGSSQFGFDVSGGALQRVAFQASTNLVNWLALQTNVMGSPTYYFSDPFAHNFPKRFYRVELLR